MNKAVAFAGGMGVGAGMMYFLDPDRGRRRRALIKDKAVSTVRDLDDDIRTAARNLKNRATGIVAEARSLVSREQIPDRILQARVESKLGRLSSHPHAISVTADDGEITLNGAALSDEVERVVRGISGMRGVVHVRNRLEVHTRSESIPQLQGGRRRSANGENGRANWSPAGRFVMGATGGALAVYGLTHRNVLGAGASAVGAALLTRGISNRELTRLIGLARAA